MANCCFYTLHAVSKSEKTLKRLLNIMNQTDNEYYIYRCDQAVLENSYKDGEYFVYEISGDVAWSCSHWVGNTERNDDEHTLSNGAHYVSLDILAKRLDFAFEIYAEETGNQFQQHIVCDHNGSVQEDTAEWSQTWQDEDGNDLDEPVEDGGFGDEYCNFMTAEEVY